MKRTFYILTKTAYRFFLVGVGVMALSVATVVANVVLFVHFGLDVKSLFPIGIAFTVVGATIMLVTLWMMPREIIEVDANQNDDSELTDMSAMTTSITAASITGSTGVPMF